LKPERKDLPGILIELKASKGCSQEQLKKQWKKVEISVE